MLDIQAELHEAGQPYQDIYDAVAELKRRHDLHPCAVQPRDGLSLRDEGEREAVQDLVVRFRRLPEDTRRRLPALWNSLAQLEVVVGDLEASLADFQEVARLVSDPISRAEAHHNVYRAALERRDWDTALAALKRAVALEPETFEPFPFSRFEPERILGASGLGVSFLCKDRGASGQTVVVKSLRTDSLDQDATTVFRDAAAMQDLDHPALVRVSDTGHAGPEFTRPYLVLERVEGRPLPEVVAAHGPFAPDEWMEIAWPVLRALQALHGRGILHRGIRPSAVLVRRVKNRDGATCWAAKLLDAGLALKRAVIHASASNPEAVRDTGLGRSVGRLVRYAPPEVVGRPKGQVWVGPHSDLFSFGKLCAYGLTGNPDPDDADRLLLPDGWQKVLDACTAWTINRRPSHAGAVADQLSHLPGADALVSRIERDMHESSLETLTARLDADPDDVDGYVQRAAIRLRQSDLDGAVADYDEAIRRRPEDASLLRRRAQTHIRAGRANEAVADYTAALKLEPRNLEAIVNRGLAYAQLNEHDRAIEDFTEGIRLNPRAESLYCDRGNAHHCKGDAARAIADYTESLRLDPRNLWTLGNRARAYLMNGEPARAVADYTRLLQLDPANVKALYDRAGAHLELGRHDRAIADYSEALRLEPTAALYHDRGLAHAAGGDFARAVADFTEALGLSQDNPAVLISRGKAHADLQQYDQALADLTESLRLAPQGTSALVERAAVHSSQCRHDEAVTDLTAAIGLAPSATAYFQRGNVFAESGDFDRAIADFTEVIRLDPGAAPAFTNRGLAQLRLGDVDLALEDLDRALAIDPDDPATLLSRAGAQLQAGNPQAALANYDAVLRLDPASTRAYTGRALVLAEAGDFDRALADLDVALRLEPDNAQAYHDRGLIHAERRAANKAIADLSEALRLDPDFVPAWYNRAVVHAGLGDDARVIADLSEVIRLEPGHAEALVNRGIAHERCGEPDRALADYTASIQAAPEFLVASYNRASLLARTGDDAAALADVEAVLKASPGDVGALLLRGRLRARAGAFDQAIADNLSALAVAPDDARIVNNLAWLWATAPRADLRDPARAVEFALKAVAAGEDAGRLDTLAAAYAATGRFPEAAETQRRAISLATEAGRADFASRLARYEKGEAYVEAGGDDGAKAKNDLRADGGD